jgi:hypothetical protein
MQNSVDLVQFKELRSLDWRGLSHWEDFESVRKCIEARGHQIQSLTLDLVDWKGAQETWDRKFLGRRPPIAAFQGTLQPGAPFPSSEITQQFLLQQAQQVQQALQFASTLGPPKKVHNFFLEEVLKVSPGDRKVVFSSLKKLDLSFVSFYPNNMEMAYAFNVEGLQSLRLRDCRGSLDWFNSMKLKGLKSLELAFDRYDCRRDSPIYITETICNVVQHASRLESFFLMLVQPIDWNILTNTLSSNLHIKRLVMHRLVSENGGHDHIDRDIPWSSDLEPLLQGKQLTCFGTSTPVTKLVCINCRS